jgi:hypothetical protein
MNRSLPRFARASAAFLILAISGTTNIANAASINLPPGSKVKIHGHTASVFLDNGVSGQYECTCSWPGKGTCSTGQSGQRLTCGKDGLNDTCTSDCQLTISTTGLSPAMKARMNAAGLTGTVGPAAH